MFHIAERIIVGQFDQSRIVALYTATYIVNDESTAHGAVDACTPTSDEDSPENIVSTVWDTAARQRND